jgi:hypothetical protein
MRLRRGFLITAILVFNNIRAELRGDLTDKRLAAIALIAVQHMVQSNNKPVP